MHREQIVKWERKPTRCNRCLFLTISQHVSGIIIPIFRRTRRITACGVLRWFCWMWLVAVVGRCLVGCEHCEGYPTRQRPTTATNHIQQNQRSTPPAVISLVLLKMGMMMPETCWDIVKNKHLLHLVGFLSHFTKTWTFSSLRPCQTQGWLHKGAVRHLGLF